MSGWEKVMATTLVLVIGLAALNLAIWRRVRLAVHKGGTTDREDGDVEASRTTHATPNLGR